MKILLDADTGVDDALGIIYLAYAQHKGWAEILATGAVGGNVHVDLTTRNTLKMWELTGLDIPVAKGANKPLLQPLTEEARVHGDDGLANTHLGPPRRRETGEHAVDQILRLSHEHAGELTLLAFGPLTNLGIAFLREPDLAQRLKRVVLMGGSTHHGNVTPVAEANIANDPEAARLVFASGAPITMVGLNVTYDTFLLARDLEPLHRIGNDKSRLGVQITQFMMNAYAGFGYDPPICVLHDPLAAGAAVHPELVRTEKYHVAVETAGSLTRGMTVVDQRIRAAEAPTADVAVEVKAKRFTTEFMESLLWWAQNGGR